jgi:predicted ester cyclase
MTQAATETRAPAEFAREVFEDVLNKRDADALLPYWAEDIVEVFPTGTIHGREGVHAFFAETFAALPDFHIEADRIVGDAETVFVKWRMTATFSGGPWLGIEPTGDPIELEGIDCFTCRDGVAIHNFVRYDQISFARQIGMLPADGSAGDRAMTGAFNARTRLKRRFRR